jgi:hypothetical protein
MRRENQPRYDLTKYPIQENVWIEVYWRDDPAGRGPCASLYVGDLELLRYDCFAGDQGHLHVDIHKMGGQRLYYPPGPVRQHIDRTAFEVSKNVPFALRFNHDPAIQQLRIDPEKLLAVAQQTRERLLELATQLGL